MEKFNEALERDEQERKEFMLNRYDIMTESLQEGIPRISPYYFLGKMDLHHNESVPAPLNFRQILLKEDFKLIHNLSSLWSQEVFGSDDFTNEEIRKENKK